MSHKPIGLTAEQAIEQGEVFGTERARYDERTGRIQLDVLLKSLGGTVCTELRPHADDLLYVYEPGRFTVNVPSNTSKAHDRLRIARAIGHYELHFIQARESSADGQQPHQAIFEKGTLSAVEKEANAFSMGLLLPAGILLRLVNETHHDTEKIAEMVELPRTFVDHRLDLHRSIFNHSEIGVVEREPVGGGN